MARKGKGEYTGLVESGDNAAEITIEYSWSFTPGVWTMPNGDPGYPDESEIDIDDWSDEDGNKPAWVTQEMLDKLLDEANIDFWEDDEPDDYEPDYED